MNILYLTNHLNVGGITSYVLTLSCGLKKKGHSLYIASSGGRLLARFREEGIEFIQIPIRTKNEVSPKILASLLLLSVAVKKYNVDIVHSNSRTTQVLGCLLSRKRGIPHISTCHGFFKKRFFRRVFPCWGLKVIAISESVKEHLMRDFGVKEDRIRLIHNGIDLEKFKIQDSKSKIETRNGLGLGEGPVLGIVARLSDVKGHIYLIEAMRLVLERQPQAQLLIAGEGKMKQDLLKLCRHLKIEKSVLFVPETYETEDILSIMDLFVMPSLKEGLGLAVMEAMACGLPVVASGVGGIKSLIQDGLNGLLVRPADSKELSRAILEVLENPDKAKSLGHAAQSFISRNFSQERMVLETEEAYRNV